MKRKVQAQWRVIEAIPEGALLALFWLDPKPGYDHIMLQAVDDEEVNIQIMQNEDQFSVSIFDPHDNWIEEFDEYGD